MTYNRILRLPAVINRTGLSRSTIYLRIMEGTFPPNIRLGSRSVGWLEIDIDKWIEEQISISRLKASSTTQ